MSISSSATGLRPGVCTSTTRPTTPYTGQIIYETDTGYLRVWDGANWDYLSQKQDDTVGLGPVGGLVYINTLTLSSVATGSINSVFSSTYQNYRLVIRSGAASANTALFIQFRAGATAYTTADQDYGLVGINMATGAADNASSGTAVGMYIGNVPTTAGRHLAIVDITNPFETTFTVSSIDAIFQDSGGALSRRGGGIVPTSTSYDGFQITTNGAPTVSTVCRIYGYRNS